MAPPSQLAIATSAVNRLVKEEASYHKELQQEEERLKKLQADTEDENAEFMVKQQQQAIEQTKAMFPALKSKIKVAVDQLEKQIEQAEAEGSGASAEEITKAKEAVESGKKLA